MAIEVGAIVEGKVTGVTNFGAFIDLGEGKVGLIHISQIAGEYVTDINRYLKVGDQVKVKVLGVTKEGKYDLSIKQALRGERKKRVAPYSFEEKITQFLKESEEKLSDLKKNIQEKQEGNRRKGYR